MITNCLPRLLPQLRLLQVPRRARAEVKEGWGAVNYHGPFGMAEKLILKRASASRPLGRASWSAAFKAHAAPVGTPWLWTLEGWLIAPMDEAGSAKGLKFLHDHVEAGVFDPHAVSILIAAFDGAWQSIKASGARLSDKQIELVRANLAKYIIEQARQGELDQCRLRDGALLHLARSNLRDSPPRRQERR
jgi:hypothetical protein